MADPRIRCSHNDLVSLTNLKPNPKNRNKHPKKQIERLAAIIQSQGQRSPIVVSRRSGYIVKGAGRLEAIKLLGWETAAVDYQDYDSEVQEYQDMIADNEIARYSEFQIEDFRKDLDDFTSRAVFMDKDLFGLIDFDFSTKEEKDAALDTLDSNLAPKADPRCSFGDIWQLGRHRIMCGDSLIPSNIERLLGGVNIDVVYTDPPYGINLDTDYSSKTGSLSNARSKRKNASQFASSTMRKHKPVIGDQNPFNINYMMALFPGKQHYIWGGDYFLPNVDEDVASNFGMIVWDKNGGEKNENLNKSIPSSFELCLTYPKRKRMIVYRTWNGLMGRSSEGLKTGKSIHPTQKPISLHTKLFDMYFKVTDQVIFDGFLGTGSTLLACEKKNLTCYGMELDKEYCDWIIANYEHVTGSPAEKL
jgi:DNA modification methylase